MAIRFRTRANPTLLDVFTVVATHQPLPDNIILLCKIAKTCMENLFDPFQWILPLPIHLGLRFLSKIDIRGNFIPETVFPCLSCDSLNVAECWVTQGADFSQVQVRELDMSSTNGIRRISPMAETVFASYSNLEFLHDNMTILDISGCNINFQGQLPSRLTRLESICPSAEVVSLAERNAATLEYLGLSYSPVHLSDTTVFPVLTEYDVSDGVAGLVKSPRLEKLNISGTTLEIADIHQYSELSWLCLANRDLLGQATIPCTVSRVLLDTESDDVEEFLKLLDGTVDIHDGRSGGLMGIDPSFHVDEDGLESVEELNARFMDELWLV